MFNTRKQRQGFKEFLLVLPFIILIAIVCYYPLYGWVYAFYDYKPPQALTPDKFVGLKWFKSMVENPVKVKQILGVLRNTFAISGLSRLFS